MALDDHPALLEYRAALTAEKEVTAAHRAARNVADSLHEAAISAHRRTREAREAILAVLDENPDTYPGWAAVSRFGGGSDAQPAVVTTFATAPPTENTADRRTHPTPDRRANA